MQIPSSCRDAIRHPSGYSVCPPVPRSRTWGRDRFLAANIRADALTAGGRGRVSPDPTGDVGHIVAYLSGVGAVAQPLEPCTGRFFEDLADVVRAGEIEQERPGLAQVRALSQSAGWWTKIRTASPRSEAIWI